MPKKPTKPAAKAPEWLNNLEDSQRALVTEFAGIVQHMPSGKVRPLVDLLIEIRGQNYVNVDIFEMIKRETSVDVKESYANFAKFLELMNTFTLAHAKAIRKAVSQLGEHGEKSMYRTIAYEIESLKEGIHRGAVHLAPKTQGKARRAS
jgi:hypothetical protein